jgi:hypothetical protein
MMDLYESLRAFHAVTVYGAMIAVIHRDFHAFVRRAIRWRARRKLALGLTHRARPW